MKFSSMTTLSEEKALPGKYPQRTRLAFILGLLAFLLYANTFTHGFVLDDFALIVNNQIVNQGASAIPNIFTTPYLHGYVINPNDLYRPLSLVMFAIEYQLSGGDPMLSHVVNVALFTACVVLLFFFIDALLERKKTVLAFVSALLFALLPVHTEVVANIKSRDELLCFFFAFLALNAFLQYLRGGEKRSLALGTVLYFLSLLSKETSLSFIVLLPVLFLLWEKGDRKRGAFISLCSVAAIALFFTIRFSVLNVYNANHPFQFSMVDNALAGAPSISIRLATAFLILGKYLWLLLIPHPLLCDYSYNSIPLTSFADILVWVSLLVYLAIIVLGIRRLSSQSKDVYALAAIFFLIPLALFSNTVFLVGATMAERFLFFPSVGFCLLVANLVNRFATAEGTAILKPRLYMILVPLGAIWAGLTIYRSSLWKDPYTLFRHDMAYAPNNYRIPYYLGTYMINASNEETDTSARNAQLTEAVGYLKQSIAVYPAFNIPYAEVGQSYLKLNQYDSAELYNLKAVSLNSRDTFARNNLAAAYFKQGKYRQAITECRFNISIDPHYTRAYTNIGACYLRLGIADSAIAPLRTAVQLEPDNKSANYFLSVAYQQSGNADSAKKYEALARSANL